jgi:hypothetical protein
MVNIYYEMMKQEVRRKKENKARAKREELLPPDEVNEHIKRLKIEFIEHP